MTVVQPLRLHELARLAWAPWGQGTLSRLIVDTAASPDA
jgi:hypothetical protein